MISYILLIPLLPLVIQLVSAHLELCRCTAPFERFYNDHGYYKRNHHLETDMIPSEYPYNYDNYYVDEQNYVIVEGIRVLPHTFTECSNNNNNNGDEYDDDTIRDYYDTADDDFDPKRLRNRNLKWNNIINNDIHKSNNRNKRTKNRKLTKHKKQGKHRRKGKGKGDHENEGRVKNYGKGKGDNDDHSRISHQTNYLDIFSCPDETILSRASTPIAAPASTIQPTSLPTSLPTITPTSQTINCPTLCNDNNLCTVDTCNNTMVGDGCTYTPIACSNPDEVCDYYDGLCKTSDALRPCVAVIDESDCISFEEIDLMWTTFRSKYPDRPFCLLHALDPYNRQPLYLPNNFLSDPRVSYAVVNRDMGDVNFLMDWFTLCKLDTVIQTDIEFISFFIDESGSMDRYTVYASYTQFINDLTNANLKYCTVFNTNEDWITPFDTPLGTAIPETTGDACLDVSYDDYIYNI